MRTKTFIATAALLLLPVLSSAQDMTGSSFNLGRADFGVRFTDTTGDAARYERYRDLGDGLFLDFARYQKMSGDWLWNFQGDHFARRDMRLMASATRQGMVKAYVKWDQIPMLMSRDTQTFYKGAAEYNTGFLSIDDAVQTAGQASGSNLAGFFMPPFTKTFDLETRRHIAEGGLQLMPTNAITINGMFRNTTRQGSIPYGGSFGHSQLTETLEPINHTLRDFDANIEWAQGNYLARVGYNGSWFRNDQMTMTFDNPFRLTSTSSASAIGRSSLPPGNTFFSVNGLFSVKLPAHSRFTASVSGGSLKDVGDPIMPITANPTTTGILPFERTTVDGAARTMSSNVSFSSRPTSKFDFGVRFRSYKYDNQTPVMEFFQRVSYDNALSNLSTPLETEPFAVTRYNFDADAHYVPMAGTSIGVGFTRLSEARTHRIFEDVVDNTFRVVYDTMSNRWFTVRAKYERSQRRGSGLDEELLEEVGEQPGLRHFDIADRDRNRFTLVGMVMPLNNLSVNVSVAAGNDDYLDSLFGLRDNNHRVYGVGFDATPTDNISLGVTYNRENYLSLSRSRQANPGAQQLDESRNWAVDGDDLVHSVIVYADFMNLADHWDIHLGYDTNRSTSMYRYITGPVANRTLPEETPNLPSTLPTPTQLPDVVSNLDRATFDLTYNFTKRIGLGFSYWYENWDVQDFALDADSTPSLTLSNAVLLGYLYRPYTAHTGWARLIIRW